MHKLDPTDEQHSALVAAFLTDHDEHAPYLAPQRRMVVRDASGTLVELTPTVVAELQNEAYALEQKQAKHVTALAAWSANAKLRTHTSTSERRHRLGQLRPQAKAANAYDAAVAALPADADEHTAKGLPDRVHMDAQTRQELAALEHDERLATARQPEQPTPAGCADWVALVRCTDWHATADEALATLARASVQTDDKHRRLAFDLCPHPGCCELVEMTNQYRGRSHPRFSAQGWDSIPPWADFGFCDIMHAKRYGAARHEAFAAFSRWLLPGAAQLAADLADASSERDALAHEVEALRHELAEHAAGVERMADYITQPHTLTLEAAR